MQYMQVGQAFINELHSSKQINYFIIIYRNVHFAQLCTFEFNIYYHIQRMNEAHYSVFECLEYWKEKEFLLTLFDYKLAVQLFLDPVSNIEFLQRPTPSDLSLIELHYDGLALTVV